MARKKKKYVGDLKRRSRLWEHSFVIALVAIGIVLAAGLVVKSALFSNPAQVYVEKPREGLSQAGPPVEALVQLVASEFLCACGSCGELPLVECNCDMPQGALEEKAFIGNKLRKGLQVEEVILLVENRYGHKISR